MREIFKKLKGRLWIPYQVNYEFLKNRSKVIMKPIGSYTALEKELKQITDVFNECKTGIFELKSKTKKDDKHPVLDQQLFKKIDEIQLEEESEIKLLNEKIKEIIILRKKEIEQTVEKDLLYDAINQYFEVGTEITFDQQMTLVEQGKLRYEFKIPPGYQDGKEKEGTQIFGDLFAWKEIISHAKEKGKPIILISNDMKPDWCVKNEKNITYVDYPRHELIKEIGDAAKTEFWMYSNPQLLYFAQKYLSSAITADQVKEVNAVANEKESNRQDGLSCVFSWLVDETTCIGSNKFEKSLMYLFSGDNRPLSIDWGDASLIETVTSRHTVFHSYPAFGEYTVSVYGDVFWFCAMGIGLDRGTQFPKVTQLTFLQSGLLDRLQSFAGQLKVLDLSKMVNLTQLLVGSNQLTSLNLTTLRKLLLLFCEHNQLTELDVSNNVFLGKLDCSNNQLSILNLEANNILDSLKCLSNQLTSINLKNNNNLTELNCAYNQLNGEALDSIFRDLPFVRQGRICIKGNLGIATCNRLLAETKGWTFFENPYEIVPNIS